MRIRFYLMVAVAWALLFLASSASAQMFGTDPLPRCTFAPGASQLSIMGDPSRTCGPLEHGSLAIITDGSSATDCWNTSGAAGAGSLAHLVQFDSGLGGGEWRCVYAREVSSGWTVRTEDGAFSDETIGTIRFPDGTLTANAVGDVSVAIPGYTRVAAAALPGSPTTVFEYLVVDGQTAIDCSVGGATGSLAYSVICAWQTGVGWRALGVTDLRDLPQDGATDSQVMTWNNAASEWQPQDATGGGFTPDASPSTDHSSFNSESDARIAIHALVGGAHHDQNEVTPFAHGDCSTQTLAGQEWCVNSSTPFDVYRCNAAFGGTCPTGSGVVRIDQGTFDDLAGGTNTTATMVVGSGAVIELEEGGGVEATEVIIFVQNETGATIEKCTAVHVHEFDNPSVLPEVVLADSDDDLLMPALGITYEQILDGASGRVILSGLLSSADTSSSTGGTWGEGDRLYVDDSGTSTSDECGDNLTKARPSNTDDNVQAIATVIRAHGTQGKLVVSGAGRSNDVPNLTDGAMWVGDASNIATPVDASTFIDAQVTANSDPGNILFDNAGSADGTSAATLDLSGNATFRTVSTDDIPGDNAMTFSDNPAGMGLAPPGANDWRLYFDSLNDPGFIQMQDSADNRYAIPRYETDGSIQFLGGGLNACLTGTAPSTGTADDWCLSSTGSLTSSGPKNQYREDTGKHYLVSKTNVTVESAALNSEATTWKRQVLGNNGGLGVALAHRYWIDSDDLHQFFVGDGDSGIGLFIGDQTSFRTRLYPKAGLGADNDIGFPDVDGTAVLDTGVFTHGISETASVASMYGGTHIMTASTLTLTLPAAAAGMHTCVMNRSTGPMSIGAGTNDAFWLFGVATILDDEDLITSSIMHASVCIKVDDQLNWIMVSAPGASTTWEDGGAPPP